MTRSPNKEQMEENSMNLQDHVTVEEITGSANAMTRRKGRVTPKRNRKSPPRNFQLLLLQAFNMQAMQKTSAFLLMWSWKCSIAELKLLHSSTLVQTTVTFHTSSSYWGTCLLLIFAIQLLHHLIALIEPILIFKTTIQNSLWLLRYWCLKC